MRLYQDYNSYSINLRNQVQLNLNIIIEENQKIKNLWWNSELNWYTTFESKIYSDEFYNKYYRDEIISETTKVRKNFIEELEDLKIFTRII